MDNLSVYYGMVSADNRDNNKYYDSFDEPVADPTPQPNNKTYD